MTKNSLPVILILRVVGGLGLFAIPAIFLPVDWMAAIHAWAGLGEMPNEPVVTYLARSLSAFYGAFSLMTLYLSTNVQRYQDLVTLWGYLFLGLGVLLLGVDLSLEMPAWWIAVEGPPSILVGASILWLQNRRSKPSD